MTYHLLSQKLTTINLTEQIEVIRLAADFRQFNGHTQVNATDLRNIPYPSSMQLVAIGQRSGTDPLSQEEIDALIREEIAEMSIISNSDPSLTKKRIDEALALIRELGFPRAQQNERSALTLLALLHLTPTMPWPEATAPLCGITPMMDFFAEHYGKQYKPNTRETVRRQTVHQFLEAGIIIANPDDPARPINSPKAVYQIEASALELLQTYGSDEWDVNLRTYLASVNTLKQRYAQERELQRPTISWSTEVCVADAPDHLIHFNGDRFLGPYTQPDHSE